MVVPSGSGTHPCRERPIICPSPASQSCLHKRTQGFHSPFMPGPPQPSDQSPWAVSQYV